MADNDMTFEGLHLKGVDERKRERNDKVVKRYTLILQNDDGDKITITTEKKRSMEMVVGGDVDLKVTQAQQLIKTDDDDKGSTDDNTGA